MAQRLRVPNRVFFCVCAFSCDCYNFIAILAEIFYAKEVLGASELQMGFLGAVVAFCYTVCCIWTGLLSERVGRRRMILIGCAGQLAAYLAMPHVKTMPGLYFVTGLRSVATSFYWPPLMAWMTETSRRGSLSGTLGGFNVAWSSGILVGFALSGVLFEYVSPAAPFYTAAVFVAGLIAMLLVFTPGRLELESHHEDFEGRNLRPYIYKGLLLNGLQCFSGALVLYLFPKAVGNSLGEAAQSRLFATRMLGTAITFAVLARTHYWHFRRWPMWTCIAACLSGLLLIASTRSYSLYLVGFAILGLGSGLGYKMGIYYALALVKTKGLGGGLQETLIGTGQTLGPLYGGIVASHSSPRTSILAGTLPIAAAWAAVHVISRSTDEKHPTPLSS